MRVTWLFHVCNMMTPSRVWHDSSMHMKWSIPMWNDSFEWVIYRYTQKSTDWVVLHRMSHSTWDRLIRMSHFTLHVTQIIQSTSAIQGGQDSSTNYTALLRKMTYEDKAPHDCTPPCSSVTWLMICDMNSWYLCHDVLTCEKTHSYVTSHSYVKCCIRFMRYGSFHWSYSRNQTHTHTHTHTHTTSDVDADQSHTYKLMSVISDSWVYYGSYDCHTTSNHSSEC